MNIEMYRITISVKGQSKQAVYTWLYIYMHTDVGRVVKKCFIEVTYLGEKLSSYEKNYLSMSTKVASEKTTWPVSKFMSEWPYTYIY